MPDELEIRSRRDGSVGIVALGGEARLERVSALRSEVASLRAAGAKSLILDLSSLTFADSASVGALLDLQRTTAAAGGKMVLVGCPPRLRRQMEDMGLAGRFAMSADEASARKSLA